MDKKDLKALSGVIAKELSKVGALSVAGARMPNAALEASNCCEGYCPCDSRNGGECPCDTRCACDGKVAYKPDDMMLFSRLALLGEPEIKRILEVAPLMEKIRGTSPER